jgi:hypothetical protein
MKAITNIQPKHKILNDRDIDEIKDNIDKDTKNIKASNHVIDIVADILEEIVKDNEKNNENESNISDSNESAIISVFTSNKTPQISIKKYLTRIMKYSKPETSTVIICLIYIDKICENSTLQLSIYNIHRIILSCMILALKYNEDDYYSNKYYAKVGGISLKELNELEYNIMVLLQFNFFIDDITYEKYQAQLNDFEK